MNERIAYMDTNQTFLFLRADCAADLDASYVSEVAVSEDVKPSAVCVECGATI